MGRKLLVLVFFASVFLLSGAANAEECDFYDGFDDSSSLDSYFIDGFGNNWDVKVENGELRIKAEGGYASYVVNKNRYDKNNYEGLMFSGKIKIDDITRSTYICWYKANESSDLIPNFFASPGTYKEYIACIHFENTGILKIRHLSVFLDDFPLKTWEENKWYEFKITARSNAVDYYLRDVDSGEEYTLSRNANWLGDYELMANIISLDTLVLDYDTHIDNWTIGNEDCKSEPACTDNDNDGYGYPASDSCTYPEEDCDDTNPAINPGAQEVCNGVDDNCEGNTDEGFDDDYCVYVCQADGHTWLGPGGTDYSCCGDDAGEDSPYEVTETSCADGQDNDCDGLTDSADDDCDFTNPDVFVSHSPAVFAAGDAVTYTATATDPSGIKEIRIFVDGDEKAVCIGAETCSYTEQAGYASGQAVQYSASAKDNSPNENMGSAAGEFTVCRLNSVSVAPDCGGDECDTGERIEITADYEGTTCPSVSYIQVDACATGGCDECNIQAEGGDIQGMQISCTSPGVCTGYWIIPDIPPQCIEKTMSVNYPNYAGLYDSSAPPAWKSFGYVTPAGSFSFTHIPVDLSFVPPTPENNSFVNTHNMFVNVSSQRPLQSCTLSWMPESGDSSDISMAVSPDKYSCYREMTGLSEGTFYFFRVLGTDTGGYPMYTPDRNASVDYTNPDADISVQEEINGYVNTPIVTLVLSFSDSYSGVKDCRYRNEDAGWDAWEACTAAKAWTLSSGDGSKTVYYQVRDNAMNTNTTSIDIYLDTDHPDAWIEPLTEWVNASAGGVLFFVNWSGSDSGSGIEFFNLQYKMVNRSDGSVAHDWEDFVWNDAPGDPDSAPVGPDRPHAQGDSLMNYDNHTILFRINASDYAGNWLEYAENPPFENTTIDVSLPVCGIVTASGYYPESFALEWSGFDRVSGVKEYEIRVNDGSGWENVFDSGICTLTDEKSADCTGMDGVAYNFSCRAEDNANNTGGWSENKTIKIDSTKPLVWFNPPLDEWTNKTEISINWDGSDSMSGISCFYVEWCNETDGWNCNDDENWDYIDNGTDTTSCVSFRSITFGPLKENTTYRFRLRAEDNAGNLCNWVYTRTTADFSPPEILFEVKDSNGNPITDRLLPSYIDKVNISSAATDSISGVDNHSLNYIMEGGHESLVCRSGCAAPYGGTSLLYIEKHVGSMIEYWAAAVDRAGNKNETGHYYLTRFPLANFNVHSLDLALGESFILTVYVRNMKELAANVTVNLTGYPLARFAAPDESSVSISEDKRNIVVFDMIPGEQRGFEVMVYTSDIGAFYLNLTAENSLSDIQHVSNTDSVRINIGYYPAFPGLNWTGILLAIAAAMLVYYRTEK